MNYLPNNIFDNADIVNIISENLKGKQKIVYDTICKNNGINRSDLVNKTGLGSNEVKNAIDKLAKKELIEFKGNNTVDGKYYIKQRCASNQRLTSVYLCKALFLLTSEYYCRGRLVENYDLNFLVVFNSSFLFVVA